MLLLGKGLLDKLYYISHINLNVILVIVVGVRWGHDLPQSQTQYRLNSPRPQRAGGRPSPKLPCEHINLTLIIHYKQLYFLRFTDFVAELSLLRHGWCQDLPPTSTSATEYILTDTLDHLNQIFRMQYNCYVVVNHSYFKNGHTKKPIDKLNMHCIFYKRLKI